MQYIRLSPSVNGNKLSDTKVVKTLSTQNQRLGMIVSLVCFTECSSCNEMAVEKDYSGEDD